MCADAFRGRYAFLQRQQAAATSGAGRAGGAKLAAPGERSADAPQRVGRGSTWGWGPRLALLICWICWCEAVWGEIMVLAKRAISSLGAWRTGCEQGKRTQAQPEGGSAGSVVDELWQQCRRRLRLRQGSHTLLRLVLQQRRTRPPLLPMCAQPWVGPGPGSTGCGPQGGAVQGLRCLKARLQGLLSLECTLLLGASMAPQYGCMAHEQVHGVDSTLYDTNLHVCCLQLLTANPERARPL